MNDESRCHEHKNAHENENQDFRRAFTLRFALFLRQVVHVAASFFGFSIFSTVRFMRTVEMPFANVL